MNRTASPKFMQGVIVLFRGKEVSVLDSHLQGGKWVYQLEGIPDVVPETQLRYAAMNHQAVARELAAVAKILAADRKPVAGGRTTIILTKDDFRNNHMWESILEQTGEAFGEEANFNEPETVELTVVDTKAY